MENQNIAREDPLSELTSARKRITELESLGKSQEKYRQIVENANSIILLMDIKGNIIFLNQFGQRFFGFYEQEVLGKSVIGKIVSEKDVSGQDLAQMIKDIVENPECHSVNENENVRRNGERVRILWTNKAVVDDNGNIKEILCIGNEVNKKQAK